MPQEPRKIIVRPLGRPAIKRLSAAEMAANLEKAQLLRKMTAQTVENLRKTGIPEGSIQRVIAKAKRNETHLLNGEPLE